VAWLITPLIAAATFGISLLLPEVSFSANMDGMFERYANILSPEQIEEMKNSFQNMPIHPFWITLLQGLFAGITINAIAGFGEELGWRGFLLRQLNQQSFIKASLLIGIIWGIWHSPIILM
jgi:membrane protease YdiL (CAAX protease family)